MSTVATIEETNADSSGHMLCTTPHGRRLRVKISSKLMWWGGSQEIPDVRNGVLVHAQFKNGDLEVLEVGRLICSCSSKDQSDVSFMRILCHLHGVCIQWTLDYPDPFVIRTPLAKVVGKPCRISEKSR